MSTMHVSSNRLISCMEYQQVLHRDTMVVHVVTELGVIKHHHRGQNHRKIYSIFFFIFIIVAVLSELCQQLKY